MLPMLIGVVALTAVTVAPVLAAEPKYPTKPVRIIVPYPPGGTTDPTARAFSNWFAEKMGTTFVIDNRPGAGSTLGHGLAAKATPDGYTLVLGTSGGLVVSAAFGSKLAYDPVKDFTPIGVGVYVPFLIVVHPSVPVKSVRELVELARAQPGKINFASPGTGTPNHLGMELLTSLTGAKFTHVPYKGGGAATADLLAGRVQAIFGGAAPWQPHMASGKARAIAIGHPVRLKALPDIPAIAETYPGFNNTTWYGFLGPAGTPAHVVRRINAEMKRAVEDPGVVRHLEGIGMVPTSTTPQEMAEMIRSELARWKKVVAEAGIKPES
ncbi:MAG: Bug family tripartite tricarboxylate transporter substrate binding protein [Betaproteobacteria bacterium]|jgi:tripartite-type tricarboxylate transporter receptor subunit TctC|nr:tripartite tricarboxylate transporter substrate binding protein [Betaproteobacteria bacterium]